jgi:predicted kinase
MIKAAEVADPHKSIVFDATNATRVRRAEYVAFARRYNLPVKCIPM